MWQKFQRVFIFQPICIVHSNGGFSPTFVMNWAKCFRMPTFSCKCSFGCEENQRKVSMLSESGCFGHLFFILIQFNYLFVLDGWWYGILLLPARHFPLTNPDSVFLYSWKCNVVHRVILTVFWAALISKTESENCKYRDNHRSNKSKSLMKSAFSYLCS